MASLPKHSDVHSLTITYPVSSNKTDQTSDNKPNARPLGDRHGCEAHKWSTAKRDWREEKKCKARNAKHQGCRYTRDDAEERAYDRTASPGRPGRLEVCATK